MAPGSSQLLDQEPRIARMATGADMAIPIAHRARGAIHEKTPASKAKGKETAANAMIVLLAASPTTIRITIPPRPMKKAKIDNAILIPNPALLCMGSILSAIKYRSTTFPSLSVNASISGSDIGSSRAPGIRTHPYRKSLNHSHPHPPGVTCHADPSVGR